MKGWLAVAAVPVAVGVMLPLGIVAAAGLGQQTEQGVTCVTAAAGKFSAEQTSIAATAAKVAAQRHLPTQAVLVILATGFQESGIRNLPYGDRDSLGWLQQRANWGTAAERLNPGTAAGKFYDALIRVAGWESLPVTVAAQRVQVSAFPNAYAKWEASARSLLSLVGVNCTPAGSSGGGPVPATFDRQGNPRTVDQAIGWYKAHLPNGRGVPVVGQCERWATLAYGWPGGYPTALAHWNAPGPRAVGYSSPPRGALIYWRTGNPAGHVALSLGNGTVISTDYNAATHRYQAGMVSAGPIADIDQWGPRLGFRPPSFRSAA